MAQITPLPKLGGNHWRRKARPQRTWGQPCELECGRQGGAPCHLRHRINAIKCRKNYVLDSINVSAGYVRPVREGEEVLNAGLVISVGI